MLPWDAMWRAALRAGVGPGDFWRLSVREWRWLAGAGEGVMRGGRLEELMRDYPDEAPAFAGDTESLVGSDLPGACRDPGFQSPVPEALGPGVRRGERT